MCMCVSGGSVCLCVCVCVYVWCVHSYQYMLPRYTIYQQNVLIITYNEKRLCTILYFDYDAVYSCGNILMFWRNILQSCRWWQYVPLSNVKLL